MRDVEVLVVLVGACAVFGLLRPFKKGRPFIPRRRLPPFDVYIINLDGATDRLRHFTKEIAASDFSHRKSFIRFSAVDGASLDLRSMVSKRAFNEIISAERTGFRLRHYQLSRGAVGCYASHVRLWESILKTDKEVALVFEDDAQIYPTLNSYLTTTAFPEDFDILLLGFVCFKCRRDEGAGFHRVKRFFGLHGYLISTKGIRKILANPRMATIHKQIDSVLSDMASAGEITVYATPRKYVEQNNESFETQIQLPIKEGEDPWAALKTD